MFVKLLTITVSFQNLHFLYSFFPIFFFFLQSTQFTIYSTLIAIEFAEKNPTETCC